MLPSRTFLGKLGFLFYKISRGAKPCRLLYWNLLLNYFGSRHCTCAYTVYVSWCEKKGLNFELRGKVGQLSKRKRVLCWSIYIISSWMKRLRPLLLVAVACGLCLPKYPNLSLNILAIFSINHVFHHEGFSFFCL